MPLSVVDGYRDLGLLIYMRVAEISDNPSTNKIAHLKSESRTL